MFCVHCGTYLEREISICPYCRESLREALDDIEFHNKEEIKKLCPDINAAVNIEFMGYKNSFDSQYSRIINTYKFFEKLLYRNKTEFVKNMVKIQEFDDFYVEKLISLAMNDLKRTALLAEALFHIENFYIKYDTICRKYEDILKEQFKEIESELKIIREEKAKVHGEMANNYQKKMDNNYETRWVGGGFGITGAIMGGIQASLMNAGVAALTGAMSTVGFVSSIAASNIRDRNMRSKIFNSEMFRIYVTEKYSYAMQEILIWNCEKIHKELASSLFRGELYNRAKAESRILTQEMTKEQLIQKFYEILQLNPYYLNIYTQIYVYLEEVTSKDIIELVSYIGNEINVKYLLMQADENLIKENTSFLDDSKQIAINKFHNLQKLSDKNLAYCDYELATYKIACMFKDGYVRNWVQAFGLDIRKTVGYYNYKDALPVRWDYAEHNAAYAYTLYEIYLQHATNEKFNVASQKELLIQNEGLLRQIKCGNKVAICIWAAMYTKYSIIYKKDVSKYTEIVWKLANQGNALAMSLIGEWFDQGIADYPENKYIAEMYFRMAMLQGNPYAIAYIGYYYKIGWAGYPKDESFAGELFNLAEEVPFSRSKRGK